MQELTGRNKLSGLGMRAPSVKDLLPSKRTKRATFRATMPMLPYMLPSGRTKRATFEVLFLSGGNRHKVSKNLTPLCAITKGCLNEAALIVYLASKFVSGSQ